MKINYKNIFTHKNIKIMVLQYLSVIVLLLVDLLMKIKLEQYFLSGGQEIVIIPNILSLTYAQNTGAAFSMLSGSTTFLTMFSLLFIVFIIGFDVLTEHKTWWHCASYALIIAGGIGNFIDRAFLGYVRDFIRFDFVNFSIFNLADTYLTIGIMLYAIYLFFVIDNAKHKADK